MKTCAYCGNAYGSGEPVREKCCSTNCSEKFHELKHLMSRVDIRAKIRTDLGIDLQSEEDVIKRLEQSPLYQKEELYMELLKLKNLFGGNNVN